jgi:hypothetical protein
MKDLRDYLVGVAVGVRYRNNFSIEDKLGSIVDVLLYGSGSLLNAVTFPMAGAALTAKRLDNPKTGDTLIINNTNIVLDVNFSEHIPKEKAGDLIDEFFRTVTGKIYKIVDIHEVYLIGVVYKYAITDTSSSVPLYKSFQDLTVDDVSSIRVNFTKKILLPDGQVKKEVNDYENVICTLEMEQSKKGEYLFQVDYQRIFAPQLASVVDIQYKNFIEKVNYYNNTAVSKWIDKYATKKME